jgi:hypothetical protein
VQRGVCRTQLVGVSPHGTSCGPVGRSRRLTTTGLGWRTQAAGQDVDGFTDPRAPGQRGPSAYASVQFQGPLPRSEAPKRTRRCLPLSNDDRRTWVSTIPTGAVFTFDSTRSAA